MRKFIGVIFAITIVMGTATAQTLPNDSLAYYQSQMSKLVRSHWESLRNSESYISLRDNLQRLRITSNNFSSFTIFADIVHNRIGKFNSSIAADGFDPLDEMSFRLGIGMSHHFDRLMYDFYFVASGFYNKTTRDDEKISFNLTNLFQFDLGYDLVRSRSVNIYPYAGISLRMAELAYDKEPVLNPNYTNISDIVFNNPSVSSSSTRLGYQAGVGFDVLLSQNKRSGGGTFFFAKAGTNGPFWKDKFKIHGVKYDPGMKQADWLVSVGFKFGSWH